MESKLPKFSGLKRPATTTKTVVPMNRIKREPLALSNRNLGFSEPCFDLTNLHAVRGRLRAGSPESRPVLPQSRNKLRRSRSACDITTLRKATNIETLKLPRLNEVSSVHNTRPPRFGGTSTVNKSVTAANKTCISVRGAVTNTTNFNVKKEPIAKNKSEPLKKVANTTSTSTTGAGKPINKRIPPYDFKARYNDLLEKHKALKEKHQHITDQLEGFENMPEQLEECQTELAATKEHLQSKLEENKSLNKQIMSLNSTLDSVSNNFGKCKEELIDIKERFNILNAEHTKICEESKEFKDENAKLCAENNYLNEELKKCRELLFCSNMERKILHNKMVEMRGNIRVFCRVRPPLSFEEEKPLCGWNYIDEATVEIINHDLQSKNKQGAHSFNFDYVFHPKSRQEDVFEMVSPLIQSAMDGYNICIFAYGQTGSGKTFTMDGIETNVGVIPRTVDLIFQSVDNYKRLGWTYTVKATFLEIYNEVLYDLLSNEQKDMEIRMVKNSKNDIYVSNITEEIVETAEHLRELMSIAKMNRATAATVGNERSSRSHAVTRIQLYGYHAEKEELSIGTINLVDLAGSESPKTSLRMAETKNINRSLSELTNVILALLQKHDHIPYRNSKLTHLLMPSLGGNSKTLMFINVSPFMDCYVESVKSLRFAALVNSCKLAKAKRNRFLNTSTSAGSL